MFAPTRAPKRAAHLRGPGRRDCPARRARPAAVDCSARSLCARPGRRATARAAEYPAAAGGRAGGLSAQRALAPGAPCRAVALTVARRHAAVARFREGHTVARQLCRGVRRVRGVRGVRPSWRRVHGKLTRSIQSRKPCRARLPGRSQTGKCDPFCELTRAISR